MKLRLLNGSHSTLAYLGFLLGHEFVWQASRDPLLATLIERQMDEEIVPTLARPPGIDLRCLLRASCSSAFGNAALPHRTRQIAMDGSQKLPQRLLATVRERLAAGAPLAHLPLAVAGWIRYASGTDEQGAAHRRAGPARRHVSRNRARRRRRSGADRRRLSRSRERVRRTISSRTTRSARPCASNVIALFRDGAQVTLAHHLGVA